MSNIISICFPSDVTDHQLATSLKMKGAFIIQAESLSSHLPKGFSGCFRSLYILPLINAFQFYRFYFVSLSLFIGVSMSNSGFSPTYHTLCDKATVSHCFEQISSSGRPWSRWIYRTLELESAVEAVQKCRAR